MSSVPDFIAFACDVLPPMSSETFRKAKLNMSLLPQEEHELNEATKRILQASTRFHYLGYDFEGTISDFRTVSSHICGIEGSSSEKLLFLSFAALHSEVWQRHSVRSLVSALPASFSTLPELNGSNFGVYSIGDRSSSSGKAIVRNPCTYSEITHRMGRINHDLRYLLR